MHNDWSIVRIDTSPAESIQPWIRGAENLPMFEYWKNPWLRANRGRVSKSDSYLSVDGPDP